jgi:hypothetical protein
MTQFEDFEKLAEAWARFFQTREFTYIALREKDVWHLLYAREVFYPEAPISDPPLEVKTASIRAGQIRELLEGDNAIEAMRNALQRKRQVVIDDLTVAIPQTAAGENFQRLHPQRLPGPLRIPSFVRSTPINDLQPAWDQIQLELLAGETPYESFEELCLELRVPFAFHQLSQQSFFEILMWSPLRFTESSTLENGKLILQINAPRQIDRSKLRVSLKEYWDLNKVPRRFSLSQRSFLFSEEQGLLEVTCSEKLAEVPIAQAIVSYDNEYCHRWWVRDRSKSFNPRFEIHRLMDGDNRLASTFFDAPSTFESRVSLLLALLNLTVLPYGGIPQLQDGADMLARLIRPADTHF